MSLEDVSAKDNGDAALQNVNARSYRYTYLKSLILMKI
ncbi:hypothetical protein JCM19239_7361 [Vibrio variabilis]|uniref:Uncharacterized protein n=1 Tax=Vibrio variabilis TaxID=990271 RepID=A0ABQ0J7N7_9VIBR|nr:hypothetical protein JCM19239_7361 [Vibrio variabilis]